MAPVSLISSCASIVRKSTSMVSKSKYTFSINSSPRLSSYNIYMKYILSIIISTLMLINVRATTHYVATTGDNNNPGTFTQPWETLLYAMHNSLDGDSILIMPGTYNERSVIQLYGRSNIVVQGIGQVVINGYFPEFQNPTPGTWVLWDATKNIYRSATPYPTDLVRGTFEYNGQEYKFVHRRLNYFEYADLSTNNQYFDISDPTADIHVGPGVYHDYEGNVDPSNPYRIYVRLTPSRYMSSTDSSYANFSLNPNNFKLNIHYHFGNRIFMYGCSNIKFENLNFQGYYFHMQDGCTNVTFKNLKIHGGFINTHHTNNAINNNITIDSAHFTGGQFHWVPWQDMKDFSKVANSYEEACIALQDKTTNVTISNCFFENAFIGIIASTGDVVPNNNSVNSINIFNNKFERIIDDCVFIGSSTYNIDIYNNIMLGPGTGVSRFGTGISGFPGTKYIHHNIIDCSKPFIWGRSTLNGSYHPNYTGYNNTGERCHFVFSHHAGAGFGTEGDPRNIYNNTCLVGKGGIINVGLWSVSPRNTTVKHKTYNNIFVQVDDAPIDELSIYTDGSLLMDGNMYYGYTPISNNPIIARVDENPANSFYDFASFLSGTSYMFEQNGIYTDPMLDSNYCSHSNDAWGGVNLTSLYPSWPMTSTTPFRGAKYPCLTTSIIDFESNYPEDLLIYPNPSNDNISLYSRQPFKNSIIGIYDINGRVVQEYNNVNGNEFILSCQNMMPGVYMLCVTTEYKRNLYKIIISR